jgi:hypothetical protein
MRRGGAALLALLIGGCASSTPPPVPPPQAQPAAEPPFRQIVADNIDKLFSEDSRLRGATVSDAKPARTLSGSEWRVCVRGSSQSVGGSGVYGRTYVIFINRRGEITNRRLATAADGCAQERYEPLRRG